MNWRIKYFLPWVFSTVILTVTLSVVTARLLPYIQAIAAGNFQTIINKLVSDIGESLAPIAESVPILASSSDATLAVLFAWAVGFGLYLLMIVLQYYSLLILMQARLEALEQIGNEYNLPTNYDIPDLLTTYRRNLFRRSIRDGILGILAWPVIIVLGLGSALRVILRRAYYRTFGFPKVGRDSQEQAVHQAVLGQRLLIASLEAKAILWNFAIAVLAVLSGLIYFALT